MISRENPYAFSYRDNRAHKKWHFTCYNSLRHYYDYHENSHQDTKTPSYTKGFF